MLEVGYAAAFLGGVLALLSPCSALLLPAFFAYAFQSPERLMRRTLAFYVGLAAVLVPLGMGVAAVSALVFTYRAALILAAGLVVIILGVLQILGKGFSLGLVSGLQSRINGNSAGSTLALGGTYGFAGFCSGPILGSVLTVAAASGDTVRGGVLLATYAAGMAAPLFFLALLWDRYDLGRKRWLRGREFTAGRMRFHTTSLVSGLMFVLLGVTFIAYQGTSSLSALYESNGAVDLAFEVERWIELHVGRTADLFLGLGLVALLASFLLVRYAAHRRELHEEKRRERSEVSRDRPPDPSVDAAR